VLLYPASVQGAECPPEVISGINYFNKEKNVDVIIVARGGGSYEELFCFNDEGIARAVYASEIPVISAIGHEPDYTIIDYVADVRAATPTAAGEMVIASYEDQLKEIDNLALNLDINERIAILHVLACDGTARPSRSTPSLHYAPYRASQTYPRWVFTRVL
jgi:exodeoxyribonuclease VII large subunit